jgi:hypothetical protein
LLYLKSPQPILQNQYFQKSSSSFFIAGCVNTDFILLGFESKNVQWLLFETVNQVSFSQLVSSFGETQKRFKVKIN